MKNLTFKKILFIIAYTMVLLACCINLDTVFKAISLVLGIFSPFFTAICIAFIVNLPLKRIEPHLSKKLKPKMRRTIAIFLSFASIFIFLSIIILFLAPQLSSSVKTLGTIIPSYLENLEANILKLAVEFNVSTEVLNQIVSRFDQIIEFFGSFALEIIPRIFSFTISVANGTINFFIGFVVSFYLLSGKEQLILGLKRLVTAIFPRSVTEYLLYVSKLTNKTFEAFISGQLTESMILGSLCTIGLVILRIDYAVLIGVIIGISSLVPIFGSILGTIPCVFIIFVINPKQALVFLIFIFILQQLEGDIIYPRVVGKSIGISGLWVMLAMIVGGSLFGIVGLIIGIPIFAVFHTLLEEWVAKRLGE